MKKKKGPGRTDMFMYRRTKRKPTGHTQIEACERIDQLDEGWHTHSELVECCEGIPSIPRIIYGLARSQCLEKRPIWLHKILTEGTEVAVYYKSTRDVAYAAHAGIYEGNVVLVIPFKCPDRAISCVRNFMEVENL